ncbi:VCBS repeat-containing protein [Streptomyces sp. NPDC006872]|uniref:FG-GAP repeat domain-containing protein n=1 Tax=Streptomyces sp. NPDC006872 TaxID=3155720 RepID=UPI0033CD6D80
MKIRRRLGALSVVLAMAGVSLIAASAGVSAQSGPLSSAASDGSFTVTNSSSPSFAGWAQGVGANVTSGDFNNDGRTDLALTGVAGWTTIPVALSNGDGSFTVTNSSSPSFAGWAQGVGANVVSGDFNNDGRTDLALTGVAGWTTIPVALSNG